MSGSEHDVTELLYAWSSGDPEALEKLTPLVYDELRRIACHQFAREPEDHTLQPTAVVHELFLDLMRRRRVQWEGRTHFFGFAAKQIRRILVDHARRQKAGKRGGGEQILSLEDNPLLAAMAVKTTHDDLVRLDDALTELARFNPEGSRVVEMRFFAGLNYQEIGSVLGVSAATVRYRWQAARSWLHRQLGPAQETKEVSAGEP